jgi:phosphoribosylformylglycinamidine cyclo-ligase
MKKSLSYESSGVSYKELDQFKRLAQREAAKISKQGLIRTVEKSRGESAYVWEEKDSFRAYVIEGLGTKNLVADQMRSVTGKTYYDAIAQDTVAMIINDLVVVGAAPQVINAYFAVGDSSWFADSVRTHDLVRGWARACKLAGALWGGGETPTLSGIVNPKTIDLAGSAIGLISPKKRLTLGSRITTGDAIVCIESSGIHANGLSLARAIAQRLPKGYRKKLASGQMYGEALLVPTHLYAQFVQTVFDSGVDIHYMVNITGHGFRKLMRASGNFRYIIDVLPPEHDLFAFMQEHGRITDKDMYGTFNMGAGFALYVKQKDVERVMLAAKKHKLVAWKAGYIEKGPRSVVLKPRNIVYTSGSLQVRNRRNGK